MKYEIPNRSDLVCESRAPPTFVKGLACSVWGDSNVVQLLSPVGLST